MTNCGLWVNHKWVKSPLTPLTRTPVGWGASGTFLNGGAYALASKTRHYEISAQWMGTQAEIASIIDEIDTGEPIYMTDPFSYANILPHWIAKPQAMTKDAPYFTAVRPTLTGGNAVFTGTGTKTFTVSVPEGGGRFVWYGSGSGVTVNGVSVPAFGFAEDARNLCPNPTATAGGATIGVTNNAARWTVTRGATVPATPNGTTTAAQGQPIEGMDDGLISFAYNLDGLGNTSPARTVTLLARSNVQFDFRSGGSTWTHPNLAPDQWHTITLSAPANTHILGTARRAGGTAPQPTDRFWWTDITTAEDFFTGDTPDTDTHQYAWAGTPHNSASIRYSTASTVVSVPAGLCTIGMTGAGPRTVSGMVLSVGQEPVQGTPGQGYTQVQCTSVSVTGYSAPSAIDRVGLNATFIEVGGWR